MVHNERGAGRKPISAHLRRKSINIKLPPYIVEYLDTLEGTRTSLIESAITMAYNIKKPKTKQLQN